MIAIPWYFAKEQEMSLFGIMFIAVSILTLLWSPYSGTLIDRFNRKHIFLIVNICSAIIILVVASFGMYRNQLPLTLVGMVFLFTTLVYTIHYPNLYAFVQEISEPGMFGKITSYLEIQGQAATVIAGGLAAILLEGMTNVQIGSITLNINTWSIQKIFFADGITYLLSFCFILFIVYSPVKRRLIETGSLIARFRTGANYLLKNRSIFWFGAFAYAVFVTALVASFYLFATYVNNYLKAGANIYAISDICYASGALLSGIAIRRFFSFQNIPIAIIIMTFTMAIAFLSLFFWKAIILFFAVSLLLGITNAGTRILRVTYLFRNIPNQVFGRVASIFTLSHTLFRIVFLSIFAFPFFTTGPNVIYACLILSIFLILSALILYYLYPKFDKTLVKDT
jgi:hypothetical protein